MNKSQNLFLPAALLIFAVTGCQQTPEPSNVTSAQSAQISSGGRTIPATSHPSLIIQPATITTCDGGIVATVRWDAQAAHVTTNATQIWVASKPTDLKLFSEGGSKGQAQTGPWARPGTHFVLKNKDDGKTLADATIGGPKCF